MFEAIVYLVLAGAAFNLPDNDLKPIDPCGGSELVEVVGVKGDVLYTTCKR